MNDTKAIIIILVITVAVFVGGFLMVGGSTTSTPTQSTPVDTASLTRNDSITKKAKNEKVVVVEFADFQCPACAFHAPGVKTLGEKYPDTVSIVFRHFPLPQHKNAVLAAHAGEAANEQGKFWEMNELLFKNQEVWGESNNPLELFVEYAKELGLNTDEFKKVIESEKYKDKIQKDLEDATALGVNSTPTFFVNGQKIDSSTLAETVDNLLK